MKIKGSIDSAFIPIAVYMSLLLMIFGSLFYAQKSVEADLYAETDSSTKDFQTEVVLASVLNDESLRSKIGRYRLVDQQTQNRWKNNDFQELKQTLSKQSDTYSFVISDTDLSLSSGRDRIEYGSAHVASPSKEPVKVTLGLGDQRG